MGVALLPNTNGILVDSRMETSIPGVFACGNAVYVNDLADNVSNEGELAGKWAAVRALGGFSSNSARIPIQIGTGIQSITPQKICTGDASVISLRVTVPGKDQRLRAVSGDKVLVEKKFDHTSPAEMLQIKLPVPEADCREILVEII
jgi:hypothetical protein